MSVGSGQDQYGGDPYAASIARSRTRRAADRRRRRTIRRAWALALLIAAGAATVATLVTGTSTGAGGSTARRDPPVARVHPAAVAEGDWLVATNGPQPTVAQENRAAGTTGWRLPGPRSDVGGLAYGAVSGYVSAPAALPGHTERIYVSAPGS